MWRLVLVVDDVDDCGTVVREAAGAGANGKATAIVEAKSKTFET